MNNHTRKGHGTHSVAKMHTALPHELAQCMNEYENPISDTRGWLMGDKASCLLLPLNLYNKDGDRYNR